jgi:hypothetical protein
LQVANLLLLSRDGGREGRHGDGKREDETNHNKSPFDRIDARKPRTL